MTEIGGFLLGHASRDGRIYKGLGVEGYPFFVQRFDIPPGVPHHRKVTDLTAQKTLLWPVGIGALRMRVDDSAVTAGGVFVRVVFDAPNDVSAGSRLNSPSGENIDTLYEEIEVNAGWTEYYRFFHPGILRLDAQSLDAGNGVSVNSVLRVEAYELVEGD